MVSDAVSRSLVSVRGMVKVAKSVLVTMPSGMITFVTQYPLRRSTRSPILRSEYLRAFDDSSEPVIASWKSTRWNLER